MEECSLWEGLIFTTYLYYIIVVTYFSIPKIQYFVCLEGYSMYPHVRVFVGVCDERFVERRDLNFCLWNSFVVLTHTTNSRIISPYHPSRSWYLHLYLQLLPTTIETFTCRMSLSRHPPLLYNSTKFVIRDLFSTQNRKTIITKSHIGTFLFVLLVSHLSIYIYC